MNRENNGLAEDSPAQHIGEVVDPMNREGAGKPVPLGRRISYLAGQLPSLADYSIGTLGGEAIR